MFFLLPSIVPARAIAPLQAGVGNGEHAVGIGPAVAEMDPAHILGPGVAFQVVIVHRDPAVAGAGF